MTKNRFLKYNLCLSVFLFVLICVSLPSFVNAQQATEGVKFSVDPSFDLTQRQEITAKLFRINTNAYFYIDQDWWQKLDEKTQSETENSLSSLEEEFKDKIYPVLTSTFGSEWKPGIDRDERLTILFHPMIKEARGYFNSGDEYPKILAPNSNEREMVYLNANFITSSLIIKSFLAHEFIHLITFNQKERLQGVVEEVWLNEGRAEYASTLLGYDNVYEGSNLQKRARTFLENPSDSLTEWQGKEADYGVLNLFIQYLTDHYGVKILVDSLQLKAVGIPSLNVALVKNGFKEDFSQIFTNWTIAILVHNCEISEKYCYKNENLKTFYITPSINFLPLMGESTLAMTNQSKNWAGNWFRFTGGGDTLKIEFIGNPENIFKVPYATQDLRGNWQVFFFNLSEFQRGEVIVPEFRTKVASMVIMPSIQSKISGFSSQEPSFPFFWEASIVKPVFTPPPETPAEIEPPQNQSQTQNIQQLLEKIAALEKQLADLKNQLALLLGGNATNTPQLDCKAFGKDLYYGMRENPEVSCLQEFLKNQGPQIYPEGFVTGNFLGLTQAAVKRFQAKNNIIQTGYFGPLTRAAANR